jgi:hypothetical protein
MPYAPVRAKTVVLGSKRDFWCIPHQFSGFQFAGYMGSQQRLRLSLGHCRRVFFEHDGNLAPLAVTSGKT